MVVPDQMPALDIIADLLGRCGTRSSVLPATALYNEGWMLRLVLDWFDCHRTVEHPFAMLEGSRWYSEPLLASRFLGKSRGDSLAEGWTNADGVIGHFQLRPGGRGDIELLRTARQFIVAEAKLGSGLSPGTKNAPTFNQAARNVACMAHLLAEAKCAPEDFARLGFYVIAPESRIRQGVFDEELRIDGPAGITTVVTERVRAFAPKHDAWLADTFRRTVAVASIRALSWEDLLNAIRQFDAASGAALDAFYSQCLEFNRVDRV